MEAGPTPVFPVSYRDYYAKSIIAGHHQRILDQGQRLPMRVEPKIFKGHKAGTDKPIHVGIIGAGAAGLYAALILDSLRPSNPDESPKITYEILEADPMTDRAGGGRLYTHHFKSGGPNDYYDIGAMRFPKIPFMKRVFDMILPGSFPDPKPATSPIAGKFEVINYVMDNKNNLTQVNGFCYTQTELEDAGPDPFKIGLSPDAASQLVDDAIGGFKAELRKDFDVGWKELMKQDGYSTRGYMMAQKGYSSWEVDLLELFSSATSLYDCALSETVMDALDFDYEPGKSTQWYCVQGGAGQIADAMVKACSGPIHNGRRVTAIEPVILSDDGISRSVLVTYTSSGQSTQTSYDHVISTIPLGALSMVDTSKCHFDPKLQTAIRALHYDSSVKVAIQFTERWWENPEYTSGHPHKGGVSSTDQPTRTVVYPSYGIDGDRGPGASMIVSYTWAQDAMRAGSLANRGEQILINRILMDLSNMHGISLDVLTGMVKAHQIHDWYADQYSMGAFALFGPGQFKTLYPEVTKPPAGRVHLAGEATSVHHAWVLGAFNSAYRTVHEILYAEGETELLKLLRDIWGTVDEVDDPLLETQVALGQRLVMRSA